MHRKPLLQVLGPSGKDILPGLDGLWLSVKTSDSAGHESDTATIVTVGPPERVAMPKRGDVYRILMGWQDEGLVLQGAFAFDKARAIGGAERGETITLQFKAGDLADKLKAQGREHFDDETFGGLIGKVAKAGGLEAQVDPQLATTKLGYRLRWDQSLIDFATEIAEELGATLKPAGGKLIAMKRGGGTSASGRELEPILIRRSLCESYEIEIDPRPEVGKVAAAYHDPQSGARKHVLKPADRTGPLKVLPHPYRSEDAAGKAADAEIYATNTMTGTGHFEVPGMPRARAEAPVIVSEFGARIDGRWKAETVEKEITARNAFTTNVSVTAGTDKKSEAGK